MHDGTHFNRYASLEAPVDALAEQAVLVFRFHPLFAADGQDAICELDVNVFFFESGKLGSDSDFVFLLTDLKTWPGYSTSRVTSRHFVTK